MGRLDSELWRFKLRGSLIRHLPLHLVAILVTEGGEGLFDHPAGSPQVELKLKLRLILFGREEDKGSVGVF